MSYATPAELRAEYANEMRDEFESRSDDELQRALDRASSTIDRYRPSTTMAPGGNYQAMRRVNIERYHPAETLSPAALDMLRGVCLPIARAIVHGDLPLEESHPIVRDYREAMAWLKQLASGLVSLPAPEPESSTTHAPVVLAPASRFGRGWTTGIL